MSNSVLVAGIGNVFLSDDGFGVEVAGRLAARPLPEGVRVEDFGIRGVHLAYELLEGYDALILIDAVAMGEVPGTVALIEADALVPTTDDDGHIVLDAHSMSPDLVLGTLARLGGTVGQILVVGCQPASLDEGIGLSEPVAAAVDGAVVLCAEILADLKGSAVGKGNQG